MTGIEGVHHGDGLAIADLTDHKTIGAKSQRGTEKFVEGDRTDSVGRGRASFESDAVRVRYDDLLGVFEDDDAIRMTNEIDERSKKRGLAGSGGSGDENVRTAGDGIGK